MKKTLIALAAVAATGAAMAQSSVTIYGVIDAAYTSVNNTGVGSTDNTGMTSSNNATNRLGFRGSEDLGGGLKANFQIETGFSTDAPGGTTLGDRGAWVGVSGGFGEVRLGREYSTTFWSGFLFSPFGTGGVGNNFGFAARVLAYQITGQGNADATATGSQNAIWNNNSITYSTPRISGFQGHLQYVLDEQTASSGGKSTGFRLNYTDGPLSAEVAYSKTDGGQALPATSAGVTAARNLLLGGAPAVAMDHKSTVAGISYNFGVARVMANFGQEKANPINAASNLKMTNYEIGVVAPVGPGRVRAAYTSTKIDAALLATDPKASKFSVGYVYDLSKRTSLFATVAQLKNKNNLNLSVGGINAATVAGPNGKSTGYNLGITHTF